MKLDDINKDNIFKVPENYFEELPERIQHRVQKEKQPRPENFWSIRFLPVLKYAIPVVLIAVVSIILINQNKAENDAETILAQVETADIIAYLDESDVSTYELLENISWNEVDFENMSDEELMFDELELEESEIDDLLNDYSITEDYM